nr:hypothetical protein [Tanacetum cinerariifolium]
MRFKSLSSWDLDKLTWEGRVEVRELFLTMDMTIDQQVALDEALATATVHHHSIRFKMNNKKRIVNLEYFREMLHICLRIPNQPFNEQPFEEEILAFLRNLGHSVEIKKITDVNINKLHQPWRSFAAVINKCLSGKSTNYDSFCLSQAQILWGMYHKKNMDFAYLLWEDCVYQVEHKDAKKSNEMYSLGSQRNSAAYKEYYAIASGAELPKIKESVRKTQSSSDTTMPLPVAKGIRLQTSAKVDKPAKGKQPAKSSTAKGLTVLFEVALTKAEQMKGSDVPTYEFDEEISWKSSDEDDDDDVQQSEHDEDINDQSDDESHDDQEDDDDDQTNSDNDEPDAEDDDNEGNDDASHGMNVGGDKGPDAEDDDNELYGDLNINLEGRDVQMTNVHTTQVLEDTHVTLTPVNPDGQQQSSSVSSQFVSNMLNPSPNIGIDSLFEPTPWVDIPVTTTVEPLLLTASTLPPPSIPIISQVQQAPTPSPTTAPSTSLQDLLNFAKNEDFLNKLDEIIQKIIKEQVKEQVKVQGSKILPKIKKTANEQLKAKVLTRASNSSKTSYAVATDLSKLELKKILIEKMESDKSIHRSDQQKNIYKALVDAYECDKIILDTYGYTKTISESTPTEQPMQTTQDLEEPAHLEFEIAAHGCIQPWISDLDKQADSRTSFNELMDTPVDFLAFLMNRLKVDTLTPELLAGLTYELMKGSCKSLVELEFFLEEAYKATTDQLDWNNPERTGISHWGYKHQQFYGFAVNRESARDVYSKHRIIVVTELQIVEWHNYKHLDWITMHRDDEKLYKFKEGNLKRLRIQDIKDMLLLLVQGKLTNLTVEECFAFNVSLRMFTRSIVIQWRMEDLQLGVKSYQKKLNLTNPDTDSTLNDVRTALDDRLKGIQIKYLPQTIWRRNDKERAATMIQAIDKQLKTRRIMLSLEKFVGGRLYEGDFRMLQQTI